MQQIYRKKLKNKKININFNQPLKTVGFLFLQYYVIINL